MENKNKVPSTETTNLAVKRPAPQLFIFLLIGICLSFRNAHTYLPNDKAYLNIDSSIFIFPSALSIPSRGNATSSSSAEVDAVNVAHNITKSNTKKFDLLKQILASIDIYKPQMPPNTTGAILHVGKTGGSSLTSVLRNGCHSWAYKPCHIPPNETVVSRLTTYYHNPDFHYIAESSDHKFYIMTIRDPFERTISAFRYKHPYNIRRRKQMGENVFKYRKKMTKIGIYERCFPTLDSFASLLQNHSHTIIDPKQYDPTITAVTTAKEFNDYASRLTCETIAQGMLNCKFPDDTMNEHLRYDIRSYYQQIPVDSNKNVVIFVIRMEYLWDDWVRVNELLGQPPGSVSFSRHIRGRDSTNVNFPVTSDIGDAERSYLCNYPALQEEYQTYFKLLIEAININQEDLTSMIEIAERNCPALDFQLYSDRGK